jgi:hypothetical protein
VPAVYHGSSAIARTGEPVLDPRYRPAYEGPDLRRVVAVLDALG